MSNYTQTYSQSVIRQMECTSSDMATIIGRYKGAMGVYVNRIREIAEYEGCYGTKLMLDQLAESMSGLIADNEKLWENRGKREVPTDIVELERA